MRLSRGTITELKRDRNAWFVKGWAYSHKGVILGHIYKQWYPGQSKHIFRFDIKIPLLPAFWQEVPTDLIGYTSEHYAKFSLARKAMKKAIITNIKFLNSCLA